MLATCLCASPSKNPLCLLLSTLHFTLGPRHSLLVVVVIVVLTSMTASVQIDPRPEIFRNDFSSQYRLLKHSTSPIERVDSTVPYTSAIGKVHDDIPTILVFSNV